MLLETVCLQLQGKCITHISVGALDILCVPTMNARVHPSRSGISAHSNEGGNSRDVSVLYKLCKGLPTGRGYL